MSIQFIVFQDFKESCSVNIVVAVGKCFERSLRNIFKKQIYSRLNTFIMLLNSGNYQCSPLQQSGNIFDDVPTALDVLAFYLLNADKVEYSYSFCGTCSHAYRIKELPTNIDLRSIQEIRTFTNQVYKLSMNPAIPIIIGYKLPRLFEYDVVRRCQFLYRVSQNPMILGCHSDKITMWNAAFALNLSLKYITITFTIFSI